MPQPIAIISSDISPPPRPFATSSSVADGLTVPFALAAGLSGVVDSSAIVVVTAGLAEIAAGAIAMGLGGYLAARTDQEHYDSEYRRELRETQEMPEEERREVAGILRRHGLTGEDLERTVRAIASDRQCWVDFMMRFEPGLERPDPKRAPVSGATIGGAYILGGLIPLVPYMLPGNLQQALSVSIAATLAALLGFGAVKGRLTGVPALRAGLQTMVIGGVAVAAAFGAARLFG